MKTFKVYLKLCGKTDNIFVDAVDETQAKWKTLSRFPHCAIISIVEGAGRHKIKMNSENGAA